MRIGNKKTHLTINRTSPCLQCLLFLRCSVWQLIHCHMTVIKSDCLFANRSAKTLYCKLTDRPAAFHLNQYVNLFFSWHQWCASNLYFSNPLILSFLTIFAFRRYSSITEKHLFRVNAGAHSIPARRTIGKQRRVDLNSLFDIQYVTQQFSLTHYENKFLSPQVLFHLIRCHTGNAPSL